MLAKRLIARLDVKSPHLVKGVRMEGLRRLGDPCEFACRYADEGADELLYMDIVASLYGRNQITELLRRTTDHVFIPVTVGGGVRSVGEAQRLLDAGADKIALNTGALRSPGLISDLARRYGSQAIVISIEARRTAEGWQCYTECGREPSGIEARAWAREAADRGAGEILATSIDREGTRSGCDLDLLRALCGTAAVPVVASGGVGTIADFTDAALIADGVALADGLHYARLDITTLKEAGRSAGLEMR